MILILILKTKFQKILILILNKNLILCHVWFETIKITFASFDLTLENKNLAVWAGAPLSKKMMSLALSHFELASTTVTGIPMKEEQNANSSANYDVELFHKASAAQV